MKKFYFAALLLCAFSFGYSQRPQMDNGTKMNFTPVNAVNKTTAIDTIEDYLNRASGAVMYGSQDGGYVMGTGYFDNMGTLVPVTDGTGMHYTGIANARVTEVLTWFGDVTQTATADDVFARVYSVNPDTTPSALLGSGTLSTSLLTGSTSFVYSAITIAGSANTAGNDFLVAIEYPGIDDTLGIVSSNPDSADGLGEQRLRQLTTASFGGAWISIEGLWGPFDCDAFIVPVIDDAPAVSIDMPVGASGLTLLGNFPNPATSTSEIRFSISKQEEVHVKVFDLAAREIYNSGWVLTEAGAHNILVDVSTKPAGAYYYTISTRSEKMTSKLHVLK